MHRASNWTLVLLLLAAASCGPPWQVLKQASPNPLLGKGDFVVVPLDFTGLQVGDQPEGAWMAEQDADEKQSWQGDKEGMNAEFLKALTVTAAESGIKISQPPATAAFVVQTKCQF